MKPGHCFPEGLHPLLSRFMLGDERGVVMQPVRGLTLILCWVLAAPVLGQATVPLAVKQVAAPPSDIETGVVVLPDPVDHGERSSSALLAVTPSPTPEGRWAWSVDVPVGAGGGRVVFLPRRADSWVVRLGTPRGRTLDVGQLAEAPGLTRRTDRVEWAQDERDFDCLTIDGTESGTWRIDIESEAGADGFLLVGVQSGIEIYTHRTSLRAIVGEPITLATTFSNGMAIDRLEAEVTTPGGASRTVNAPAGSSLTTFTPREPGLHAVRVVARGQNRDGTPVVLTTQHAIDVGQAAEPLGPVRVEVAGGRVVFRFDPDPGPRRVILASEVWGLRDGAMVPVCWLSRICGGDRSLELDPRWIGLAGVDPASIELRQTRVHDVDSVNLLELVDRTAAPLHGFAAPPSPGVWTADMLASVSASPVPTPWRSDRQTTLPPGHRLLFVHGYCASGNPFPTSHFTGSHAAFDLPGANLSQDEFALQILAQTAQMKSFGVAAHSQGGLASLHLYTFYPSPMDWARGDRLIQSVGSPYQGTPLAGNVAVLGSIFGGGCGPNPSLTYLGAAQWLSTIPTAPRQNVWFWRTTFEDRPFSIDYCNFITDLLLADPEDGVVEASRGVLPGAIDMGVAEGWCHTSGMRDPQQTTDSDRNAQIDLRARR